MRAAWLAPLLACCGGGPAAAQILSVHTQQPARDFGVFVGDLLTSTAIIQVAPGTMLDARSLPPDGPVSPIADVRGVTVGGTRTRIEIHVTYQNFFSPEQVLGAEIPGYAVAFSAAGKRLLATVPGFRFTASTFRHDLQPTVDPAALRPDHPPVPASAPGAGKTLAAGLVAMCGGLLALAWPRAFASRRAPFHVASRQLASLARLPGEDAGRTAMLALHRAFDATAGHRVFADDLDEFVSRHQRFAPLRHRAGGFFEASRAVFFGSATTAPDAAAWLELVNDLARAERLG